MIVNCFFLEKKSRSYLRFMIRFGNAMYEKEVAFTPPYPIIRASSMKIHHSNLNFFQLDFEIFPNLDFEQQISIIS